MRKPSRMENSFSRTSSGRTLAKVLSLMYDTLATLDWAVQDSDLGQPLGRIWEAQRITVIKYLQISVF